MNHSVDFSINYSAFYSFNHWVKYSVSRSVQHPFNYWGNTRVDQSLNYSVNHLLDHSKLFPRKTINLCLRVVFGFLSIFISFCRPDFFLDQFLNQYTIRSCALHQCFQLSFSLTSESTTEAITHSTDKPILCVQLSEPLSWPLSRSCCPPLRQQFNRLINLLLGKPFSQPPNQPFSQSFGRPLSQLFSWALSQSLSQQCNQPLSQQLR